MIPEGRGGEVWRLRIYSAFVRFRHCSNPNRLKETRRGHQPVTWRDLEDTRYFRELGVTDPTKSGSIAKAFE